MVPTSWVCHWACEDGSNRTPRVVSVPGLVPCGPVWSRASTDLSVFANPEVRWPMSSSLKDTDGNVVLHSVKTEIHTMCPVIRLTSSHRKISGVGGRELDCVSSLMALAGHPRWLSSFISFRIWLSPFYLREDFYSVTLTLGFNQLNIMAHESVTEACLGPVTRGFNKDVGTGQCPLSCRRGLQVL